MEGLIKPRIGLLLVWLVLSAGTAAQTTFVTPQANTNVIGTTPNPAYVNDLGAKQQQEPSCLIRPDNPAFIFCAYNDLRAADLPLVQGDSWMGASMSNDFGQTWFSRLAPGYLGHPNSLGMGFAADPTVVAIPGNSPGLALLNYIAAFRDSDNGVFALQRWVEFPQEDQDFWKPEDDIHIIADGSEGRFIDKSVLYYLVDDLNQQNTITEQIYVEGEAEPIEVTTPTGTVIAAAAIFTGQGGGAKIKVWKSRDNGVTWDNGQKISEEQNEVTGVSIAALGQDFVVVYRRKGDNNEPDAIMSVFCPGTGNGNCSKGQVIFELCAFDQPASGTTARTFNFPSVASDGDRYWAFAALRNPGGACAASPVVPGFDQGKPKIVAMSSVDGKNWAGAPGSVDQPFVIAPRANGFQFKPAALGTKGRVDIVWTDTFREEDVGLPAGPNDLFVNDYITFDNSARVFRKSDVWMTRLSTTNELGQSVCGGGPNSGCMPVIEDPVRVSHYETVADETGAVFDIEAHLENLTLYGSGTLAFNGDYKALAARSLRKVTSGKWIPNYLPEQNNDLPTFTDKEDVFVAWGDNRDVRADFYPQVQPGDESTNLGEGEQMPYSPPNNSPATPGGPGASLDGEENAEDDAEYERPGELVAEDEPDDSTTQPVDIQACMAGLDFSQARNSNVYGTYVRDEDSLLAPTLSKPMGSIQRMFPLILLNIDAVQPKDFCLHIDSQPLDYPAGSPPVEGTGLASFYQLPSKAPFEQGDELAFLDVRVLGGSTASRAVYVTTSNLQSIVTVNAYAGTCPAPSSNPVFNGELVSSVQFSNGSLVDPAFCEDPANAGSPFCQPVANNETHDITFAAPVLQTPVFQTPTFQTPTFQTPTFQTPTFQTPTFQTPTFQTPTFQTPTFQTPTLQSSSLSGDATYMTDTMEAPTLQSDTFGTTATNEPDQVWFQDVTFPVAATANVMTTYSADIQIDDELDRDTSEVQFIAWTPNVYTTTADCYAQPAADQQIIAYAQMSDESLESLTLPFTISDEPGGQNPYPDEGVSFFGQPNKDIALTVRIWAVDNADPEVPSALETLMQREEDRQACLALLGDNPLPEDIAECEDRGTRGLITFGASSHSCVTTDADDKTVTPTPFDCLNSGNEKILEDRTGPVISFVIDDPDLEATGPGGRTVNYTATATDNVDPSPTLSCLPASGTQFGLGLNTVSCFAEDSASPPNSTLESFEITVVDTTAPNLVAPADVTVEAEGLLTTVILGPATATDIVDQDVSVSNDALASFPIGPTPVTWTATDDSGNVATAIQTVTVEDTTAPAFVNNPLLNLGPFDATSATGRVVNYALPTATDAVDASVLVVCLPAPGSTFPLGDTPVSCTATDDDGNTSPPSLFNLSVTDQTAPAISAPTSVTVLAAGADLGDTYTPDASGDFTVEANLPPPDGAAISFLPVVSDAVAADPAITCTPASGSTFIEGTTSVQCSASDGVNTSETISFSILVQDTNDPVFSVADGTIYTFEADTAGGASVDLVGDRGLVATDRGETIYPTCEATPIGGGTTISLPNVLAPGDYTVVCSVDGVTTTTISVTVSVDINDEVPPVLTIPGDGTATVQADATTGTATVNVFGPIFDTDGDGVGDTAISATDIVDTSVDIVCTPGSGIFGVGSHAITCTASDDGPNADGLPNTSDPQVFTLVVADVTPPAVVVPTSADPAALADIIEEATSPDGAVVNYAVYTSDNADPSPDLVCSPESGSTFGFGITTVTCTSTDDSGNISTSSFDVLVRDTTDPGIVPPPDVTKEAEGPLTAVALGTATANDDGDADVTITNDAPATFPVGITTVTWTATDDTGNSGSATQVVTITDTTAPVITTGGDITIYSIENFGLTPTPTIEINYRADVTATDIVDPSPTLSCSVDGASEDNGVTDDPSNGVASISSYGTWQVTCLASDSASPTNTATATFNISVVFQYGIQIDLPRGNIRAGSTIPIDWTYTDELGNLIDSSAVVPIVRWDGRYADNDSACVGVSTEEEIGEDAGSSAIRYAVSQRTWQLSWQTPPLPGRYRLVILPPGETVPGATECIRLR